MKEGEFYVLMVHLKLYLDALEIIFRVQIWFFNDVTFITPPNYSYCSESKYDSAYFVITLICNMTCFSLIFLALDFLDWFFRVKSRHFLLPIISRCSWMYLCVVHTFQFVLKKNEPCMRLWLNYVLNVIVLWKMLFHSTYFQEFIKRHKPFKFLFSKCLLHTCIWMRL